MRSKSKFYLTIIGLILIIGVFAYTFSNQLSITSISNVDISFGSKDRSSEKYYIIEATIGARKDGFEIVLPKDKEIDLGGNKIIKNGKQVKVVIEPLNPKLSINVEQRTQQKYISQLGIFSDTYIYPEYYSIIGSWLSTVRYKVSTYADDKLLYSKEYEIDYQTEQERQIGNIYIEQLGILSNGYNAPPYDYVVVADPYNKYHLFTSNDFSTFTNHWNDGVKSNNLFTKTSVIVLGKTFTWEYIWNEAKKYNELPPDNNPSDTIPKYEMLNSKVNKVILEPPIRAMSGEILVYVPQSVANGIIILKEQSKAQIVSVSGCPSLDEGKTGNLIVSVKNVGSSDYIGISVKSNNHNVNGNTNVMFNAGETKQFTFTLQALGTLQDANVPITIMADGTALSGGDDTKQLTCNIKNVIGLTGTALPTQLPVQPLSNESRDDKGGDESNFNLLYWIAGFIGITALFTFINQKRNRERRITDENLKKSASLSGVILGVYYLYLQYLLLSETLGWMLWAIILILVIGIGGIKSYLPKFNTGFLLIIGVIIFIILTQIAMGIKSSLCDGWSAYLFESCTKPSTWELLFGK